jgi:hypothetical protein
MISSSKSRRGRIPAAAVSRSLVAVASILFACLSCGRARAQELILPPQPVPPPMKYVPAAERARLDDAAGPDARVRAALELLEGRLARAEGETAANRPDAATADLGVYQAVLDDLMLYLKPVGRAAGGAKVDKGTRDLYKRVELTLNRHTARIESVRRQTPEEYQRNVRDAFQHTRDKRSECLDAFLGANLLRESPDAKPAGSAPPPEEL